MADTENILSPEELDALAAGIKDGSIESNTGLNTHARAMKHDLINEESSKGMNTSAINPINDRFLVLFRQRLSKILKTSSRGAAEQVKIQTYGDYLKKLKTPVAINIIRARPLHGEALVVIDPSLISQCFDSFFGGGKASNEREGADKAFTRTEISINNILMNIVFGALQEAWAPIQPLNCSGVAFISDPRKAATMKDHELALVSRFHLELTEGGGAIEIIYPYYALKSIRSSFLRPPLDVGKDDLASQWSKNLEAAVMDAELELTVSLAQINTTLKEFESLREDDIVYFSKPTLAKVDVENTTAFEGNIGTQGSNMAVQVVSSFAYSK
ncbi:MAG: FliM/FliN family flagellar motor switch protein [Porticoccaceae bacterium]|nr:FliM/FliN family flagellar motor switch protein [Porticoccaceae bacterium]